MVYDLHLKDVATHKVLGQDYDKLVTNSFWVIIMKN